MNTIPRELPRLGPVNSGRRAALQPTRLSKGSTASEETDRAPTKSGRPDPQHILILLSICVRVRADAQAGMPSAEASGAICVQRFDDSRTVQVTLRIAFRCVLHRCESLDIRC
jgi:hypothetical protein